MTSSLKSVLFKLHKYIAQMCVHKKVKFVVVSTHGSVLGVHLRSVHTHTSVSCYG